MGSRTSKLNIMTAATAMNSGDGLVPLAMVEGTNTKGTAANEHDPFG